MPHNRRHHNDRPIMTPTRLACAVLIATLAGCASTSLSPTALTGAQFNDPARGVVLVSSGAVQRCTATAMWAPIYDAATHDMAPGMPVVPIDEPSTSAFQDHFGTVSALSLPAGHYVIASQFASADFRATDRVPAWSFEVVAGQAVYIGELWRETPCGTRAIVHLRDNFDRDVELASKLNTGFVTHPPKKALAQPLHETAP